MNVKTTEKFKLKLSRQVLYIAKDKPKAARKFKNDLLKELKKISTYPYSFRKSIFFDDEEIRDLIFKGYVITFRIKIKEEMIEVFGFHKYEEGSV